MKKLIFISLLLFVATLFVLAQELISTTTTSTPTSPTTTPTSPKGKQVDLTCMKNAVEKRENALRAARETYFSKLNQAYEERKTALLNAWSIENHQERRRAIHSAWENFRKSVKSAKAEYRKAHNQIWKTFVQDRKNCKFNSTGENPGIDLNF